MILDILALVVGAVMAVDLGMVRVGGMRCKSVLAAGFLVCIALALVGESLSFGWSGEQSSLLVLGALVLVAAVVLSVLRALPWPQHIFSMCLLVAVVHLLWSVPNAMHLVRFPGTEVVFSVLSVGLSAAVVAGCHCWFGPLFRRATGEASIGWSLQAVCASVGMLLLVMLDVAYTCNPFYWYFGVTFNVFLILQLNAQVVSLFRASVSAIDARNLQMFKQQALKQQEMDKEREKLWEEERRRRHDQRHMLQAVIDTIAEGKVDAAREILENMRGEVPGAVVTYCKNTTANGCIALWVDRARKAGFDITVRADVPEGLDLDPVEVSVIFGNLLENAYEGCGRVERTEAHRFIKVKCQYANGRLNLSIENSSRRDVKFMDGMPLTQKRGGGVGTRSVKAIVEAHGGICSHTLEDGVFKTYVTVPA